MQRSYTLSEMMGAFYRRRWLALGAGVVVLAAGAATIFGVPTEYAAESATQIEPHHISADLLPVSFTSFEDRMRTLKHGLLARPVLERVLRETSYDPGWQRDPEEAVERLRRATEVRMEGELAGGPPSLLFTVGVRGRDPRQVAAAADLIPRIYGELTREVLMQQARNLSQTLAKELDQLSKRLATEGAKLIVFKEQHAALLPEANEQNMRLAAALTSQIEGRAVIISDLQRRKSSALLTIPEMFSEAGLAGGNAEEVLRRLEASRAAYGIDHPEVRRLERQYREALERSTEQHTRFQRERLDTQIATLDGELREHREDVRALKHRLEAVQQRLDAAPGWGERYRMLARDYETLRAKYASTMSRASDAAAAEALWVADAPMLFRVVERASTPTKSSGPNRQGLALVTLVAALGAALLVTVVAEYFDSSLRGPQDANAFGIPVLASIPRIGPRRVAGKS